MPRLMVAENEKRKRLAISTIKAKQIMYDADVTQIANTIGKCQTTAYIKLRDPDLLSVKELRSIAKSLHMTNEDVLKVVGV